MIFDELDMRDVFGQTLLALGEEYPEIVVLDADLNTSTRSVLFKQRFPARFIQCGVAEADLIGIAAGLASVGFVPIATTFAAFAVRKALDQLFMNVCYPRLNVKIPGSYAGMTATECGPSHNVVEDIAITRSLPGLKVAVPGDGTELRSFMHEMVRVDGPVYFRVEKAQPVRLFESGYTFEWGKAHLVREGSDISLLGTGIMTGLLLGAAELLAKKKGIEAEVVHFASVKPIDDRTILETAAKTGYVMTCENGRAEGGFGGAVAEVLAGHDAAGFAMVGVGNEPVASAPLYDLLRHLKLTPAGLADRAERLLSGKRTTAGAKR